MASQGVQHRIGRQTSNIIYAAQLSNGSHCQKTCEHSLHDWPSQDISHGCPVAAVGEGFSVCNATQPSGQHPDHKSSKRLLPQPSWTNRTTMNAVSFSQVCSVALITASTSPMKRSINGFQSSARESQQQQQLLPTLCEGVVSSLPFQTSEASALCYSPMLKCNRMNRVNAPIGRRCVSPRGPGQGARKVLNDVSRYAPLSETDVTSILPVAATVTADVAGDPIPAETQRLQALSRSSPSRDTREATHRRTTRDSGSGSTLRVLSEQEELVFGSTALSLDTIAGSAAPEKPRLESGTASQILPHPPLTSARSSSRRPTVMEVLRQRQRQPPPMPSASVNISRPGVVSVPGRFTLVGSLSHTSFISATEKSSESTNQLVLLRSPRSVSSGLVDTEDCGNSWHPLPLPALWRPQRSLRYPIPAAEDAEGNNHADSCVSVAGTLCRPPPDSECLSSLPNTHCPPTCSVSVSQDSSGMVPLIDILSESKRKQSADGRPCPALVCGHCMRSSFAGSLTSSGTSADTRGFNESHPTDYISLLPGTLKAGKQPMRLETLHVHTNHHSCAKDSSFSKESSRTPIVRAVGITSAGAALPPALSFSLPTAEPEQDVEPRTPHDSPHACKASIPVTQPATHRLTAHVFTLAASMSDSREEVVVVRAPGSVGTTMEKLRGETVSPLASSLSAGGTVCGASPGVVAGAALTWNLPSPPTDTFAGHEDRGANVHHRGSRRCVERSREICFLRSTSVPSMRSSATRHSIRCGAAYSDRGRLGGHEHYSTPYPSCVSTPPPVYGLQASCSGAGAWVQESTVDAPLDVLGTGMTSMLSTPDLQLRTGDSSVCGDSDLSHLIPSSKYTAGVSSISLPPSTFCRLPLGMIAKAKCNRRTSLHRRPLPPSPSPPVIVTTHKNVSLNRSIFVDSATRSDSEGCEDDPAAVATMTAVSSFICSTAITRMPQVGQRSAYGNKEESVVERDMIISFAPPQEEAFVASNAIEGMGPSCTRVVHSMLEHPDAPPFAKAAIQRLHRRRSSHHQRTQSRSSLSLSDLTGGDRKGVAADVPVPLTTSAHLCRSSSLFSITQSRNSSARRADKRPQEQCSPTRPGDPVRTGKLSASIIPHSHQEYCHPFDGHGRSSGKPRMATASLDTLKAIEPLQSDAIISRGLLRDSDAIDAGTPMFGCLTATEVHLSKVLPVKRPGCNLFIKTLFGL